MLPVFPSSSISRLLSAALFSATALTGAAAFAQEADLADEYLPMPTSGQPADPEDEWAGYPGPSLPQPPAPAPAPELVAASPFAPKAPEIYRSYRPEDFNEVSMFGAASLGRGKRGLGLYLGFPLLGARAGLGVLDSLDLGLGFDSFYGTMNELRALVRWQMIDESPWEAALGLEAGWAFFTQSPGADPQGARWLTGRRNYNLVPGILLSRRGETPRSARMFVDLRYQVSIDVEPYQPEPLGGVPPAVQVGGNAIIRMGAEMPFSARTSFLFLFGFDLHGRQVDAPFMPACSVGLVTAI